MKNTLAVSRIFTRVLALMLAMIFMAAAQAQNPTAATKRPAGVPEGFVATPFGYFHASCVRKLEPGATLMKPERAVRHADGHYESIEACAYPRYSNKGEALPTDTAAGNRPTIGHAWIEASSTTTSTSYGKLVASWIVPPAPTGRDGQTVYLFPGMEDYLNVISIIQPVLGWNSDFSNAWGIASWNCCINGTTWESAAVPVQPGDTILGTMTANCAAGTLMCATWDVVTQDVTTGKSTTLSHTGSDGQVFNWAFAGALEVYNIAQCSDYPPNGLATFFNIALYDNNFKLIQNPGWSTPGWDTSMTPQCNYGGTAAATHVQLNSGATCSAVNVTFTIANAATVWGQNLYVVGDQTELGSWTPAKGFALQINGSGANVPWSGTVALPPATNIQYKYVKWDGSKAVWESNQPTASGNRMLTTPSCGVSTTQNDGNFKK